MQAKEFEAISKERPYALGAIQTQILYDIAAMMNQLAKKMEELHKNLEKVIPEGFSSSIHIDCDENLLILNKNVEPSMPWVSVSIVNDGPDPVYYSISPEKWALRADSPIDVKEIIKVDMRGRLIDRIGFWCDKGKTAKVRLFYVR